MEKIDITEKMTKEKKYSKYTQSIMTRNRKTKSGQFIPFEIVKDKESRKCVSSSFHATSRDAW